MSAKRILTWTCAAFGATVAALAGSTIVGWTRFNRQIAQETSDLLNGIAFDGEMVTAGMLDGLPEPVRRYLSYTGVVGKPMVKSVHLHQRGTMRLSPQAPSLPLTAEQYYSVNPPGFIWDGIIHLGPLPLVRGRDRYLDGKGSMLIKVGSVLPVVNAVGQEMDQASMMRYLSEMIWFPAAFLGPNISFEEIDSHSVNVTLTDQGRTASATMYFDDDGRVTNLSARRFRAAGADSEFSTWETPVTEYGEREGLRLPVRGQAVWKIPEGDFCYIEVEITDLRYNQGVK